MRPQDWTPEDWPHKDEKMHQGRHRRTVVPARPVTSEELTQRAINRLSPKARRAVGALLRAPKEVRAEVLAAFSSAGDLLIPEGWRS